MSNRESADKKAPKSSSRPLQMVLTCGPGRCYVPYCPSSYGFKKKISSKPAKKLNLKKEHYIMFTVPVDTSQFLEWEANIPKRAGIVLQRKKHKICASHFRKEDLFEKPYVAVVDTGDKVKLEKKNVTYLKPNAVPVYFDNPGMPKYLLKKQFKRKPPKERLPLQLPKTPQETHVETSNESSELEFETNNEDCEMLESNDVVTPCSSPVMFEPYTPMYANNEINFIDPEDIPDNSIYCERTTIEFPSQPPLDDSALRELKEKLSQISPKPLKPDVKKAKQSLDLPTQLESNVNHQKVPVKSLPQIYLKTLPSILRKNPRLIKVDDYKSALKTGILRVDPFYGLDEPTQKSASSKNENLPCNSSLDLYDCGPSSPRYSLSGEETDTEDETCNNKQMIANNTKEMSSSQHALALRPVSSHEAQGKPTILITQTTASAQGQVAFRAIAPKPCVTESSIKLNPTGSKEQAACRSIAPKPCVTKPNIMLKQTNLKSQANDKQQKVRISPTSMFGFNTTQNIQVNAKTPPSSIKNQSSPLKKSREKVNGSSLEDTSRNLIQCNIRQNHKNMSNKIQNVHSTSNAMPTVTSVVNSTDALLNIDIKLTFESLVNCCTDLQLPSSQWALQRPKNNSFISFSYVNVNKSGNLVEKRIIFQGSMDPKVWFDGSCQSRFITKNISTMKELKKFIAFIDAMIPCSGTGNPAWPYSTTCMGYKHPKKHSCLACSRTVRHIQSQERVREEKKAVKMSLNTKKDSIKEDNSQKEENLQPMDSESEIEPSLEDAIIAAANAELLAEEQKLLASIGLISNI